ncbi:MAG: RNA-binding S4 domain-containing protein [Actinobacteria bacterium]|nr:RNA-binding S4 domain-containing protein [Actinomycetota bacterium]
MPPHRVRVDRWLWAARFFKTRSLAVDAVNAGHVVVNGLRAKPAKEVGPGDVLDVRAGPVSWRVTVRGVAERRGSATIAQGLYSEDPTDQERRLARIAELRVAAALGADLGARPTKRDRRLIDRMHERDGRRTEA